MPISIYNGYDIEEIVENCTVYEARRYLTELIMLNEKNKSRLHSVDENSVEESSMGQYFGLISKQSNIDGS